jgi:hypothetical protein
VGLSAIGAGAWEVVRRMVALFRARREKREAFRANPWGDDLSKEAMWL